MTILKTKFNISDDFNLDDNLGKVMKGILNKDEGGLDESDLYHLTTPINIKTLYNSYRKRAVD